METFGFTPAVAFAVSAFLLLLGAAAIVWIVLSAPPRSLTITAGPDGSTFRRFADQYQKELHDRYDIDLKVLASEGSLQNLQRLRDANSGVDIGFVQGGLTEGIVPKRLVSLGSVAYQPLWLFYRLPGPITRLSELAGKRVAVGAAGSGTRALAMTLLLANGITPEKATFLDDDAGKAATELLDGSADAVFLMGDSAPIQTLRTLIRAKDVRIFDWKQGDAYVRRYPYLNKLKLPEGSIDLGQDLPAADVTLVGPTVELIARKGLNPALSDVLLDVAQTVHGRASILQKRGEFPAPLEHEFTLSDDAVRYYKSGRSFVYRTIHNFWLASLITRIVIALVPVVLVLIPTMRVFPMLYRLRILLRIYRCYRPLLQLEKEISVPMSHERAEELLGRLDEVEQNVNKLRVPASFADQFYDLRGHVVFVRNRIKTAVAAKS